LVAGTIIDRTNPLAAGFTSLQGTAYMLTRPLGAEDEVVVGGA
jgi:hypothetical protein